jgi:hypothetical protein
MDRPKPEREWESLILPSRRDGFCLSTNSLTRVCGQWTLRFLATKTLSILSASVRLMEYKRIGSMLPDAKKLALPRR